MVSTTVDYNVGYERGVAGYLWSIDSLCIFLPHKVDGTGSLASVNWVGVAFCLDIC